MNPNIFLLFIALVLIINIIWRYDNITKTNQIIVNKLNDAYLEGWFVGLDNNSYGVINATEYINNDPIIQIKKIYNMVNVSIVEVVLLYDSFVYKPYTQIDTNIVNVIINYVILIFIIIEYGLILMHNHFRNKLHQFITHVIIFIACLNLIIIIIPLSVELIAYMYFYDTIMFYCNNYINLVILYAELLVVLVISLLHIIGCT